MNSKPAKALTAAVIGYGSIGRRHVENLARLGVGRIVLVRRREGANTAFTPPESAIVLHDLQQAIELGLDLAIVANPTCRHIDTARWLVEAGIPVLVEKPLGDSLGQATRLNNLAEEQQALCGMAYCMRYHPAYALARDALRSGRIGRVLYAKAWFESFLPAWHPWEDFHKSYAARRELGGGVLPTLDHDLDYFHWCFGTPSDVTGLSGNSGALAVDVDDWASISVRYQSGVLATLTMSFCRRDRRRGFEFIGQQGGLRFEMEQGQLLLVHGGSAGGEVLWDGREYDLNEMYFELLADFLAAASHQPRRAAPIPLSAGLDTLAIMSKVRSTSHD